MCWVFTWTCLDVSSWLIRNNINMKVRHRFIKFKIDGKKLLNLSPGQLKCLVSKHGDIETVKKVMLLINVLQKKKKKKK